MSTGRVVAQQSGGLRRSSSLVPSGPLYERAPTKAEDGSLLSDFMMLIPGLRDRPAAQFENVLRHLDRALTAFQEVVFTDLNVPLNLLWVTVRPRPGVILEIAGSIKGLVPEALLVGPRLRDSRSGRLQAGR